MSTSIIIAEPAYWFCEWPYVFEKPEYHLVKDIDLDVCAPQTLSYTSKTTSKSYVIF